MPDLEDLTFKRAGETLIQRTRTGAVFTPALFVRLAASFLIVAGVTGVGTMLGSFIRGEAFILDLTFLGIFMARGLLAGSEICRFWYVGCAGGISLLTALGLIVWLAFTAFNRAPAPVFPVLAILTLLVPHFMAAVALNHQKMNSWFSRTRRLRPADSHWFLCLLLVSALFAFWQQLSKTWISRDESAKAPTQLEAPSLHQDREP